LHRAEDPGVDVLAPGLAAAIGHRFIKVAIKWFEEPGLHVLEHEGRPRKIRRPTSEGADVQTLSPLGPTELGELHVYVGILAFEFADRLLKPRFHRGKTRIVPELDEDFSLWWFGAGAGREESDKDEG